MELSCPRCKSKNIFIYNVEQMESEKADFCLKKRFECNSCNKHYIVEMGYNSQFLVHLIYLPDDIKFLKKLIGG